MVRSVMRTPPKRAWPAKTVKTFAPSAAIRSCTAFWAPLPSATMVITAPTPMMIPSMVSSDRSLLALIARKATATVSPNSTSAGSAGRLLLLTHARHRTAAAGYPIGPLLHFLLRLHQARAWEHQDRVGLAQSAHHFAVVEVGETGADPHRRRTSGALDEHDEPAAEEPLAPRGATAGAAAGPGPATRLAHLLQDRGLFGRQFAARAALHERGPDLRLAHAGRQGDGAAVAQGHRGPAGRIASGRIGAGRAAHRRLAALLRRGQLAVGRLRDR